jgi:hypothetical protein
VTVKKKGGQLIATSNKNNFKISTVSILNDSINLTINHTEGIYLLKGGVKDGKIYGSWKIGPEKGNWEGSITTKKWWALYSDSLIALYEFINNSDIYYSTNPKPKPGFTRSEKPICKVWKNPTTQILTSFDIKQVVK